MLEVDSLAAGLLQEAQRELEELLRASDDEVGSIGRQFEQMAHNSARLLDLAADAVSSIERAGVASVPEQIACLGGSARELLSRRLEATSAILDVLKSESGLLDRLGRINGAHCSIARETGVLSILTRIEVARLGPAGEGFAHLARELDEFSGTVSASTRELACRTAERQAALNEGRQALAAALPRIRTQSSRIEDKLGRALSDVNQAVDGLSAIPSRFKECVESVAGHIGGVIAAVQSHDVTRQQMEHIRDALSSLIQPLCCDSNARREGEIAAGINVQIYQLRNVCQMMTSWSAQMNVCLDALACVSSCELAGLGALVLRQEQSLSAELAHVEQLEQECQSGDDEVHRSLKGLSTVAELVRDHLGRSRLVRDRMRLLNFNSIVEAGRLGSRANVMLEIARSIHRVSADWSAATDRSAATVEEILSLVAQAESGLGVFSSAGSAGLRAHHGAIHAVLDGLRTAAASASASSADIGIVMERMQAQIARSRATRDRLGEIVAGVNGVLTALERAECEVRDPRRGADACCVPTVDHLSELERHYAAAYTTEIERQVLRAALYGEPMPGIETARGGNDVELF